MGKRPGLGYPVTPQYRAALVAWLGAAKGRNESALARAIGCTPAAINQIVGGKRPTSTLLPKISVITKIPLPFPGLPQELQDYLSDFAVLHEAQPEEAKKLASLAKSLQRETAVTPDDDPKK